MKKKVVVLALFGLACIMAVHAEGKKDNESHEADNPEGFTSSISLKNKKTGKWNFYIEAKDKANNISRAGPENIWIDPVSDLPIAYIINPKPDMKVKGNLNIVGSCIDDDGVDHVEFTVTRGADGKGEELVRTRAEGKEFWSYYLETSDEEIWTDGVYTITVWGIDMNGLSGISHDFAPKDRKSHQVIWHLDRKKPKTKVTSHEVGGLVSGKISVKGWVYDGNGVDSLSYSLDEGITYRNASLRHDKWKNMSYFDVGIDTRAFEDGPRVIWFKAKDGVKTEGLDAHLLFVNNTAPSVEILYPDPDAALGGVFSLAVYATHPVGVKSLTWKIGKDGGEFPRVIGNSWWVQEIDIRGQKANSLDLEIRAEDLSGNVTVVKRKLKIDQNSGPVITIQEPAASVTLNDDRLNVRGVASGSEAVAAVLYSIDSGQAVEFPCSGAFQFTVSDMPAGTHTLEVWGKNIYGIEGPKVQMRGIAAPGPAPEPRIASVGGGSLRNPMQFFTGMVITPESRVILDFAVKSENQINTASVTFADRAPVPVSVRAGRDGVHHGDVAVPFDLSGLIKMELRATDRLGRESVYEDFFYTGAGGVPQTFEWAHPARIGDGRLLISSTEDYLIGVGGAPVQSASVSGAGAENLAVTVDENGRVILYARREGSWGPLTLSLVSRSGSVNFRSNPFTVLADFAPPAITLQNEQVWVQDSYPLKFTVSDANRIVSVGYWLGETFRPILQANEIAALGPDSPIEHSVNLSSLPDGTAQLQIVAVDAANHTAVKTIYVQKDTQAPQAEVIMPLAEARVNGAIRLGIAVKEAGSIGSVTYQSGDITKTVYTKSADEDHPPRFLDILTDPREMPLDDNMSIIIEDAAGNRTTINSWPFIIDNEMDIPVAHIVLPLENEIITTDFEVSGYMFDDDAIAAVCYRIDDSGEARLESGGGFSIPIALSTLTDNEHSVTVVAEDIYGVRSEPVTRNFRVSLSEPVASVSTPSLDMISGGLIEMSGGGYDENGIAKIQISVDNGNTFNDARLNAYDNTAEWFYDFNTEIISDGAHVLFIRVFDNYGISAMYASLLNIDNTLPELNLESPQNGMVTTGPINILGHVSDINLEAKNIELRSLEGAHIPEGYSRYRPGDSPMLKETMDIAELPDGFYNIEVQVIDKAANVTIISRNIELNRKGMRNFINMLYPLPSGMIQGNFNLYGNTGGADSVEQVTLLVNDVEIMTADVTQTGYYCFALDEEGLQPGWNELVVSGIFGGEKIVETEDAFDETGNLTTVVKSVTIVGGDTVVSESRQLYYMPNGAWVTIDNLTMGDFAYDRPWFSGRAGYTLSEEDHEILKDKNADKVVLAGVKGKILDYVDISFDNGGTFTRALKGKGRENDWRFRLETGEMFEGMHYVIVRANMKNGETAVTRTVLQIDKTPPSIRLIAPQAGGRYNTDLEYSAIATDDVALASLTYHLRVGDKARYEVPGFLQGLYLEAIIPPFIRVINHDAPSVFGGVTFFDVGLGLSFFDDNVKIQAQYGYLSQELWEMIGGPPATTDADGNTVYSVRYGGHVLGFKILANVYNLPFGLAFGPNWEWLQMSFSLGANFSLFDMAQEGYTQSGNRTWMGALLMQIEFPKVTIPKQKVFRTFSLFTEGQMWFIPTDVDAKVYGIKTHAEHIIVGLRMYVF